MSFLDKNFLLQTKSAETLYHDFAKEMPIIDYHCHLPPDQIAEDKKFENLTQIWLYGDHYKWRAMRTNGVNERFITGDASDEEKFMKWAETVPYTMRNPLYHWTHLELQRYFGIDLVLNKNTAKEIYDECSRKLKTKEFSVQNLLRKMNVKVVGTTDDPTDDLVFHKKYNEKLNALPVGAAVATEGWGGVVIPTYRPDKSMAVEDVLTWNKYVQKLASASQSSIYNFDDFLNALDKQHDFFAEMGCKATDHGLEQIYAEDFTEGEIKAIFKKLIYHSTVSDAEILKFKSAMMLHFGRKNHERGFVQQFHLGALRNNNARLLGQLGPDTGFDSIGDFSQARNLSKFLNKLDSTNQLSKTILYNLNGRDNDVFATMIGNFQDGTVAGKLQFGSGWWFLDQKDGMEKQMNSLSNMGLLSRFVGMITDSRSFLSFPRHEYFRRILCNLFGNDIENGELPNDIAWIGQIIQDICYNNAKNYFGV